MAPSFHMEILYTKSAVHNEKCIWGALVSCKLCFMHCLFYLLPLHNHNSIVHLCSCISIADHKAFVHQVSVLYHICFIVLHFGFCIRSSKRTKFQSRRHQVTNAGGAGSVEIVPAILAVQSVVVGTYDFSFQPVKS
ncbi:hypothetical protein HanPSC8_Chr07g0300231 [Helianthus annuus]|nr:hypothetical protein HanPSC8_Chr07g0300231 [Helianthus annuus]